MTHFMLQYFISELVAVTPIKEANWTHFCSILLYIHLCKALAEGKNQASDMLPCNTSLAFKVQVGNLRLKFLHQCYRIQIDVSCIMRHSLCYLNSAYILQCIMYNVKENVHFIFISGYTVYTEQALLSNLILWYIQMYQRVRLLSNLILWYIQKITY